MLPPGPAEDASSSLLSISADWARLKHGQDDRFYSKRHVYDMRWKLEAEMHRYTSSAAPCGGPIAMILGDGTSAGARLQIFNAAGELLSAWLWEYPRVLKLGWTSGHELLTVLETGRVLLWSLRGERLSDLGLGKDAEQQGVLRCEVWPDGLVVLTHAFRLVAMLSFSHPRIVPLAEPSLTSAPTAMCLLHQPHGGAHSAAATKPSLMRMPEVVLATASRMPAGGEGRLLRPRACARLGTSQGLDRTPSAQLGKHAAVAGARLAGARLKPRIRPFKPHQARCSW